MCVANLDLESEAPIVNGSQGIIEAFEGGWPIVRFRNGTRRSITAHTWQSENIPWLGVKQIPLIHDWAMTIHKAQGSQWDTVQVFAPDIYAAARMGRSEAGQPLWKRLAYVAITRAQNRLVWVVRNRLSKPTHPLGIGDLRALETTPLALQTE